MDDKLKYQDLIYFGYDWVDEATENRSNQNQYIKEIKERFPHAHLRDAYDDIKGFRQEVYLYAEDNDNYYSWLIGKQWFELSLTMQLLMMSSESEHSEKIERYFKLAKKQYPEVFKPEALKED